ncbi:MAG: branched-chain amino acid ABC transporter permease, partial [Cyanobacteria bacterium P01_F01_bin.153]
MDLQLAQLVVNGIALGCIIALASVGLTLTYGILRLSNFAHGDLLTLGAYLALLGNSLGLNIWVAIALAMAGTVLMALVTEKLIWSPMRDRRADSTTLIIISIGLALFIRNGLIFIWGGGNQTYDLPVQPALDFWGLKVKTYSLVVVVLTVIATAGLHFLLQKTK